MVAAIKPNSTTSSITQHRKVSSPLIIGIVLMPYMFAWFLLRKGYSPKSRAIGFGWAGFVLVLVTFGVPAPNGGANSAQPGTKLDIDPNRAQKYQSAVLAKQIVPSAMKDPSSVEFGNVWGMSATVACGFVNGKDSFGAMTGQTRFILDDGRVSFENGERAFARHWNSACVDKPHVPAPSGAGGIRWGARPPASLKVFSPATDDGLAVYVPNISPERLEGVAVAEADYSFDHGRLFSANFYIEGEAQRDAILAAFVKKYGTPQNYDEGAGSYSWNWTSTHIAVNIDYDANHDRTTVSYNHG